MKALKKILAFTLLALMLFSLCATASADGETGTITIKNTYKEARYTVYKILDAKVSEDGQGVVYYVSRVESIKFLNSPFDVGEEIGPNLFAVTSTANAETIAAWIKDNLSQFSAVAAGEGTGGDLVIEGLAPGYYYITSQVGTVVTIDTLKNSNVVVYEKNAPITVSKTANDSYSIGDTITFTATFDNLPNYLTEGSKSYPVMKYEIKDTLPDYLSDVTVTSIKINDVAYKVDNKVPQFDSNKKITIPWAEKEEHANADPTYTFYYPVPSKIEVVYTAKLTSDVRVNEDNTNRITLTPYVDKGDGNVGGDPWDETFTTVKKLTTYAAALKKVDAETNEPLAGAQFTIKGLRAEKKTDTFTVNNEEKTIVYYNVLSYDPTSTEDGTVLDTNDDGMLYIVGLGADVELTVTEFKAPEGYKVTQIDQKLTPQVLNEEVITETTTRYYDEDGNLLREETSTTSESVTNNLSVLNANAFVVTNAKGAELPETGGMGTAAYYALGALLLAGAIALALTKRRSHNAA